MLRQGHEHMGLRPMLYSSPPLQGLGPGIGHEQP